MKDAAVKRPYARIMRWAAAAALCAVSVSLLRFSADCASIRGKVLRLHVLANSDSPADQALKLEVRDAVTAAAAGLFDEAADAQDAVRTAQGRLADLRQMAQEAVYAAGYDYAVNVEICEMYFTTRLYEAGTLPAGNYNALRVTIGAGAGQNWWCVVFPPVCLSGAVRDAKKMEDVLAPGEADIVQSPEKYEVRFKVVEWTQEMLRVLGSWF